MTPDSKPARRPIGEIWKAGLIGAGVAAIINLETVSKRKDPGPLWRPGFSPVPHNTATALATYPKGDGIAS